MGEILFDGKYHLWNKKVQIGGKYTPGRTKNTTCGIKKFK